MFSALTTPRTIILARPVLRASLYQSWGTWLAPQMCVFEDREEFDMANLSTLRLSGFVTSYHILSALSDVLSQLIVIIRT